MEAAGRTDGGKEGRKEDRVKLTTGSFNEKKKDLRKGLGGNIFISFTDFEKPTELCVIFLPPVTEQKDAATDSVQTVTVQCFVAS